MQRIRMTRSLLTELSRCNRSFILSLFWHGLDNDSLAQKEHGGSGSNLTFAARRDMICSSPEIATAIANAKQVVQIDCSGSSIQTKLDKTWDAISSGDPVVIYDGALEGGDFVIPFSILIVRDDGMWEVFHQSTKTFELEECVDFESEDLGNIVPTKKTLNSALSDAAPLMYVLSNYYADNVARFAVLGADKNFISPFPDPKTGEVTIDPHDTIYWLELDASDANWSQYLGYEDPMEIVDELQSQVADNPFWIPDAEMGSKCGASRYGYICPYNTYCTREREAGTPNHIQFYLPSTDRKKLEQYGIVTMDDLLEVSYVNPALDSIPPVDIETIRAMLDGEIDYEQIEIQDALGLTKKVWIIDDTTYYSADYELSDRALRALRAYEDEMFDVEDTVDDFFR